MNALRLSRLALFGVLAVGVLGTLLSRRCADDTRRPIVVDEGRVVITNLTGQTWTDVDVWLNTWYRAQAPALAPGQRLEIPLRVFTAGPGRTFDARARAPVGIEVSAKASDGSPVTLTWGEGRRR
ncbi:MAG: hypothetical protein H6Q10_1767 [Acidobacteria bacterium]|nr:hypothetical protein [Acidobacteriota bacterium]